MRRVLLITLLLFSGEATAQKGLTYVGLRLNVGVGICNKPNIMFGAPFAFSGELSAVFNKRWRIAPEFGVLGFRDSKHPNDNIGFFGGHSRYGHGYYGLLLGYSIMKADRPQKLFVSSGADYLLITDPNVKTSSGFLSGKYFDYLYKRYLNIPIQLDYSILPFKNRDSKLVFIARWNFNAYHSFPMLSLGIDLPMYPFPRRWGGTTLRGKIRSLAAIDYSQNDGPESR